MTKGHQLDDLNIKKGDAYQLWRASLMAQSVKNLLAMQETWVQFLGREDPLEKEMATHSSILAWRIPMDRGAWQATDEGVARVRHDLVTKPPPPGELVLCNSVYSTWADRLRGGVCGGWGTGAEVGGGLSFL